MKNLYYATYLHGLLLIVAGFITLLLPQPHENTPFIVFIVLAIITMLLAPPLRKESKRAVYAIATLTLLLFIFSASRFWSTAQPTSLQLETFTREALNQQAFIWGIASLASAALLFMLLYAILKQKQQYKNRALNYRDRTS